MPYKKSELAWAAGFFDGEGCTTAHLGYGKERLQPRMRLSQMSKDEVPETLLRFQKAVQLGKLYGPYRGTKNPFYVWAATRLADVESVVKLLWPFLSSPKRQQIKKCFVAYRADRKLW